MTPVGQLSKYDCVQIEVEAMTSGVPGLDLLSSSAGGNDSGVESDQHEAREPFQAS